MSPSSSPLLTPWLQPHRWMEKGFILEASENLNARLNVFPDVHLLKSVGDPEDAGSAADLALVEEGEDEAKEEGWQGTAGGQGGGSLGDAALQMLGVQPPQQQQGVQPPADAGDEAALQAALALSMQAAAPEGEAAADEQRAPFSLAGAEVTEGAAQPADDDEALVAAIALSMEHEVPAGRGGAGGVGPPELS